MARARSWRLMITALIWLSMESKMGWANTWKAESMWTQMARLATISTQGGASARQAGRAGTLAAGGGARAGGPRCCSQGQRGLQVAGKHAPGRNVMQEGREGGRRERTCEAVEHLPRNGIAH